MSAFDGLLIHEDGVVEKVHINDYRGIQDAVGGYFDVVNATEDTAFWVHDEGLLIGLPINRRATFAMWKLAPDLIRQLILVGPVLVSGGTDDEGNTLSVGDEALELFGVGA